MNTVLVKIGYKKGADLAELILREFHFALQLEFPQKEEFRDLNKILKARFALQLEFAKLKNALNLPIEDVKRENQLESKRRLDTELFQNFMQTIFSMSKEIQRQEESKNEEFTLAELREVIDLLDQSFDNVFAELDQENQEYYLKFMINE